MKLVVAVILLCLSTATLQAQNPTFEETVDYIVTNTKGRVMYPGDLDAYSRVEGYHLKDVKIDKSGKIELITDQDNKAYGYKNNFAISFNIFDLVEKVDYPDGIRAHKFLVHFNGLNVSSGYGITFATDADAQKVARAFRHLKTLCTKPNDLFSKVPDEEKKPKLSREETIKYINNLLSTLSRSQLVVYKNNYPKPPSSYLNDKAEYTNYWFPKEALIYNPETKEYSFTNHMSVQYYGLKYGEVILYDEQQLKDIVVTFDIGNITGFEEDWDGKYEYQGKSYDMNGTYRYTKNFSYFRLLNESGGWVTIRYAADAKFTSRLKKAFLRLKELDKDDTDPFDD